MSITSYIQFKATPVGLPDLTVLGMNLSTRDHQVRPVLLSTPQKKRSHDGEGTGAASNPDGVPCGPKV